MSTEPHDHDLGLVHDLTVLLDRRHVLKLMASAGVVSLIGCAADSSPTTSPAGSTTGAAPSTAGASSTSSSGTTTVAEASTSSAAAGSTAATEPTSGSEAGAVSAAECAPLPEETAGPFPGDGSNGPNILTESGIVRRDIRSSIGSASGTAAGILLTINLTVQDSANGCGARPGAAVYLWHCDREGLYSMYSDGATEENYLRGVQEADADGRVSFTSIFPACYSGRWPHAHFEVYPSLAEATGGGSLLATSQLALPAEVCDVVYATEGYEQSVANLGEISLESDNVFGDGASAQLAAVSGDVDAGFTADLAVPV